MTRFFRHIVVGILCGCYLLVISCQKAEPYRITPDDKVFIQFNAAVIDGGSGSDGKKTASVQAASDPRTSSEAELVHTLRVVIVSQDPSGTWTVEANEFYAYDGGGDTKDMTFAIEDGRKKKVYLFANCDLSEIRNAAGQIVSLGDPEIYKPDASGKPPVEDFRFTWVSGTKPTWIPMSAVYDLDIPEKKDLTVVSGVYYYRVKEPLYLVRGVTKLSLSCRNTSASRVPTNIQLQGWEIAAVATGETYLLAHVADNWRETTNPKGVYKDWMSWLVAEAEKTQKAGADPKEYEWLTAYDLPKNDADIHKDYVCTYPNGSQYHMYPQSGMNTLNNLASHYLTESKYVAGDGAQRYTITFKTWEWEKDADYTSGIAMTYTMELPYLKSLFRNTEVRLSVDFKGDVVALEATVCPWTPHDDIEIPVFE